jgi:hypothetical protein
MIEKKEKSRQTALEKWIFNSFGNAALRAREVGNGQKRGATRENVGRMRRMVWGERRLGYSASASPSASASYSDTSMFVGVSGISKKPHIGPD